MYPFDENAPLMRMLRQHERMRELFDRPRWVQQLAAPGWVELAKGMAPLASGGAVANFVAATQPLSTLEPGMMKQFVDIAGLSNSAISAVQSALAVVAWDQANALGSVRDYLEDQDISAFSPFSDAELARWAVIGNQFVADYPIEAPQDEETEVLVAPNAPEPMELQAATESLIDHVESLVAHGMPPGVGPGSMRAAVPSMGTGFSILSRAAVSQR